MFTVRCSSLDKRGKPNHQDCADRAENTLAKVGNQGTQKRPRGAGRPEWFLPL
jgi:hypothetical protein